MPFLGGWIDTKGRNAGILHFLSLSLAGYILFLSSAVGFAFVVLMVVFGGALDGQATAQHTYSNSLCW